ncbi:MAG: DUF1574 family protein [Leptospiraceae bacterium]|nr:DUF1574 family protein [Leptospiraceae bacterium]
MNIKAWMYYPLFLLLILFGVDKLCLLDEYKRLTMSDAPFLIFDYKPQLIEQMVREMKPADAGAGQQKLALILGTSRLLFFDYDFFQENYPDWKLYNYSAPITFPAYYWYILDSVRSRGLRPDLLIIETAAFQYSDGTDLFQRSNLAYSFDLPFILRYFNQFTRDEVSGYLGRFLFASYRYPPRPGVMWDRYQHPDTNQTYRAFQAMEAFQQTHNGSARNIIPKESWFQMDRALMQYQAQHKTLPWLYTNAKISERHFYFLTAMLHYAHENQIKVVLVRPAVSQELQAAQRQDASLQDFLQAFDSRRDKMLAEFPAVYIDFNQRSDYICTSFVDDAHMAVPCYHAMMDIIMDTVQSGQPRPASP